MQVYVQVCTNAVHIYVTDLDMHVCACMHVCIHTWSYLFHVNCIPIFHVYLCIHIFIHMHVHTHTHITSFLCVCQKSHAHIHSYTSDWFFFPLHWTRSSPKICIHTYIHTHLTNHPLSSIVRSSPKTYIHTYQRT